MTREDAINRQAAINAAIEAVDDWDGGCNKTREEYIRKALETIPPVTPAEKQKPCEDCISRKQTIDAIKSGRVEEDGIHLWRATRNETLDATIELIQTLPLVNPAEKVGQWIDAEVLDKIKAEILEEKDFAYADFEQYKVDYLGVDAEYVEDELPQDDFRYGMERALEIIDKYKVSPIGVEES